MPTNVEIDVTHYETKMRELLARAEEMIRSASKSVNGGKHSGEEMR